MLHDLITHVNTYLTLILAYGFSVTVAGAAKAWIAKKMGDFTADYAGYLTLDPLVHVDLMGLMVLLFTGFGWGRNVPVSIENIRAPRRTLKVFTIFYSSTVMHILLCGLAIVLFAALMIAKDGYFGSTVFGKTLIMVLQGAIGVNTFLAMLRFIQASVDLIFMHAVELHPEYSPYIELGALIASLILMIFLGRQIQGLFFHIAAVLSVLFSSVIYKLFAWM
jgi:hypothetical protein